MRCLVSRNLVSYTETSPRPASPYALRSLGRGLLLLERFVGSPRGLTLTELAPGLGWGKATAFRYLSARVGAGYLELDAASRRYRPTVRVLRLGGAYLASLSLPDLAAPFLERLSSAFGESVNMAVLDETEVVYVARVSGPRILSTRLAVGSRLPAHATSMGKVLLAHQGEAEQRRLLSLSAFERLTPKTVASASRMRGVLAAVRRRGYAVNDQELDLGLRSCAAPVFDRRGAAVAAVNLSTSSARTTLADVEGKHVPAVVATAGAISEVLKTRY